MRPEFIALAGIFATTVGLTPAAPPGPRADQEIRIRFAARVGDRPFACGETYAEQGATASSITPTDFRFYVHGIRLVDKEGNEVPLQLEEDSLWQHAGVSLLDFENGVAPCSNGNAPTRTEVVGRAPKGKYTGLRFVVGVPFELNHRDLVKQPSPLNITSLFWAWRSGYKFLRLDMRTSGPAERIFLHLGSTGCTGDSLPEPVVTSCRHPNRAEVALDKFDLKKDVIITDVAALLSGADLDNNQPETAKGCMSAPDDRDCSPIFRNLGLPFGDQPRGAQSAFRAAKASRELLP